MDITNTLLKVPPGLLLILLMMVTGLAGTGIAWTVRRYIRIKVLNAHNEATGYIFSVVAGFYALLLAFVVFQALDSLDGIQRDADIEGSLAKSMYRQISYYPDTADIAALKKEYTNYINLVVKEEYPAMAAMKGSEATVNSFSRVFMLTEKLFPPDVNAQEKSNIMFQHLEELAKYRSLRVLAGDSEISFIMWLCLLLGGLLTLIFTGLLNVENQRYLLLLSGLMGAFLGLVFFLIIILDHPFSGSISVEPKGYQQVLKLISEETKTK